MRDSDDLERLIDRELRQLPRPRAPRTLLPRVMAAAHARGPVVARPLPSLTAADGWRLALAAALALVVAAGVTLFVWGGLAGGPFAGLVERLAATAVLMRVLWDVLLEPVVTYAAVFVLVVAFAASACWSALRHLALEGASQS
jgi:hypothetical protein